MKKKGFTLIELLTVIVILAILIILVLPDIMKFFIDSKENAFLIEVKEDYLKSRGQPLQETVVPEFYKSDLLVDLKNYAKRRPVTEEIREFYERLLEELYLK